MHIAWYQPHQPPSVYQPRYFPVALSRLDDTLYLPALDALQVVEQALDRLFADGLITVDEFDEVLFELHRRQLPGEELHATTLYKVPVQSEQFEEAPGLHPFKLRVRPRGCSVLVRELRWLQAEQEEDKEPERRLGVWLWVATRLPADLVDVDVEHTYLADATGRVIARLAERPQPYARDDLDEQLALRGTRGAAAREARFALTLVFEAPNSRRLGEYAPLDVLHLTLRPLEVHQRLIRWEFTAAAPPYPLIKSTGETTVLVEGIQRGTLSSTSERRLLDERNRLDSEEPGPYYAEHPVLLVTARLPEQAGWGEEGSPDWRSPLELLSRCPVEVSLRASDGSEIRPLTTTVEVHSSHVEELEAAYHFPQMRELPPVSALQVEVLEVTPSDGGLPEE